MKSTYCIAHLFFAGFVCLVLSGCQPSDGDKANALLSEAKGMVDDGHWRQARILLDSIHSTYPKQVVQRRCAKALCDSITYLESQRDVVYYDSILRPLLPQADHLLKVFKYEKDERYDDHGRYVHRLLCTNNNTSRCFLQAYVQDNNIAIVKSYYYGTSPVEQQSVCLTADGEEARFSGSNHAFEAEGWHEIMTIVEDDALQLLNFVSTHTGDRVRVSGAGNKPRGTWVYYLSDTEKKALNQTYQLGVLMRDIDKLERIIHIATAKIEYYENKYANAADTMSQEN